MPLAHGGLDRIGVFQLSLLLLAVPVQFLITKLYSTNEVDRNYYLKSFIKKASVVKDDYLSVQAWTRWCSSLLDIFTNKWHEMTTGRSTYFEFGYSEDPNGESPAVEVMEFLDPNGHFGRESGDTGGLESAVPRSPRAPHVKYRVGQVVQHTIWGYRGVIVAWDETARAPKHWLSSMHPKDNPELRRQPNYAILVDTRDRLAPQLTYVPEAHLKVITQQILHPDVDNFFEVYDGAQYIPRPFLRTLYPHD